ncbi:anaphase-promoting complex subunit cdc27 [Tilletia horrida]|nr:anaphase-promoting complex subunit cdc27 [Tilletia horrida]
MPAPETLFGDVVSLDHEYSLNHQLTFVGSATFIDSLLAQVISPLYSSISLKSAHPVTHEGGKRDDSQRIAQRIIAGCASKEAEPANLGAMYNTFHILSHDRLIHLANRFLWSGGIEPTYSIPPIAQGSSASSSSALPNLKTPDYLSAAFYSFLCLARFPDSIPARRILAACTLAGADPFPFAPSASAGSPPPVTATPGLLVGGVSTAAAHAALQLLQSGPKEVYDDVGCATLFAQASAALSAYSEAHDALSWTVDKDPTFKSLASASGTSAFGSRKGKEPDITGLGISQAFVSTGSDSQSGPSSQQRLRGLAQPELSPGASHIPYPIGSARPDTQELHSDQTNNLASSPASSPSIAKQLMVSITPQPINAAAAQRSQTLTSLGHLAAKGNRLVEAAASFQSALECDPWSWAAWAGLCDVARVGHQTRGATDGGNEIDTLDQWSRTHFPAHQDAEFLPSGLADLEATLMELNAQETEAEAKWRRLAEGGSAQSSSASQTKGSSQGSQPSGTQRKGTVLNGSLSQGEKRTAATTTTSTTTSHPRAGSRTTTGSRTAAGNPGSNKRLRSGTDVSVASSTRSATTGATTTRAASSENRTTAAHQTRNQPSVSVRPAIMSRTLSSTARTNVSRDPPATSSHERHHHGDAESGHPRSEVLSSSQQQQDEDEPMLIDEADLAENKQNVPVVEPTSVGLVKVYEKGTTVRRSTRTGAQGGAGQVGSRTRATGVATGTTGASGLAARRAATTAGVSGRPISQTAASADRAGNMTTSSTITNRSTLSTHARSNSTLSARNAASVRQAGSTTSTVRAPKSSSSTDSSYGAASVSTVNAPSSRTTAGSVGSLTAGKGTRRTAASTLGLGASNAAHNAAIATAFAELGDIQAKKQELEKQIRDVKTAAHYIAQVWTEVDEHLVTTVRQLAEAYRTVRLYEGRKTAWLCRSSTEVERQKKLSGGSGSGANAPHQATEEQQVEEAANLRVYGKTPFTGGLPDSVLNSEPVRCLLGRAAHDAGKYAEAERQFDMVRRGFTQGAIFRSSTMVPTRHMDIYSLVLFHLNREVKLSGLAQELALIDANAAETHIAAGNAFALQRDHGQAMRAFKRAALIAPGCAYAYTLAGYEAIELAQLERAVGFFRSAIRVDMRHWNAWAGLGQIFLKIGKTDWAEAHYREALTINPHHAVLKGLLGWVSSFRFDQFSLRLLTPVFESRAQTYESQGRWNEALNEYDATLAMSPKLAMTRLKRAELLTQMEHFEDAHEELLRVAALVPDESRVHILLAKSYMRLGNGAFADPNQGGPSGSADKSASMAAQEPIAPNKYHDAIAFHLSAAIDLDPKNVRIVKAMGEGARVALKGTRRPIDASAMDSTLDSSMYAAEQSGEVFEDGPDESGGLAGMSTEDAAMEDGMASEDDEEEDEEVGEDEEEDGEEEDGEEGEEEEEVGSSQGSEGELLTGTDDENEENNEPGQQQRSRHRRSGGNGGNADDNENIEPSRSTIGEDSVNSYPGHIAVQHEPNVPEPEHAISRPPTGMNQALIAMAAQNAIIEAAQNAAREHPGDLAARNAAVEAALTQYRAEHPTEHLSEDWQRFLSRSARTATSLPPSLAVGMTMAGDMAHPGPGRLSPPPTGANSSSANLSISRGTDGSLAMSEEQSMELDNSL